MLRRIKRRKIREILRNELKRKKETELEREREKIEIRIQREREREGRTDGRKVCNQCFQ